MVSIALYIQIKQGKGEGKIRNMVRKKLVVILISSSQREQKKKTKHTRHKTVCF